MKRSLSLSLSLIIFLLAGCDLLGTAPDPIDDTSNQTIAPVTQAQLVGTWKWIKPATTNSYGYTQQITYKTDGTFEYIFESDHGDGTYTYSATKGTYSVDTQGYVSVTYTHEASPTSFSLEGVTWETIVPDDGFIQTQTQPVFVIGNQLYTDAFIVAQGTTSGIVGPWGVNFSQKIWDANTNAYVTTYYKWLFTLRADGTFIRQGYESNTDTFGLPSVEASGTYTYNNGTLTVTYEGQQPQTQKIALYKNVIIFGDETSPSAHAYIKQ